MSGLGGLLAELQRRSVIRAAVVHVLVFWVLVQVADVVLPYIGIVDEPVRWAVVAGVALFPVTLVIAWFFEHPWTRFTRGRVATDIILIALIGAGTTTWVLRNLPQVVHTRTSIVVLPFDHADVADGESISRVIAIGVNSLLMQSRSIDTRDIETALSPRLIGLAPPAIAEQLRVMHVLDGSITRSDDRLRISARLVNNAGSAVWERVFEDELHNLTGIQEDIAAEIQALLGTRENAVPVAEIVANRCWMPEDPAAIEKYYTARYYTELRTDTVDAREKLGEAIHLFRELIEDYPGFAEAHSGLAWALAYQRTYDPGNAVEDWLAEAQTLARAALEQCSTLGEAMHLLPNEFDDDNRWIGEHQQLTAFIEMEPHRTENRQRLARHYRDTGLTDRSLEVASRNYELNPLSVRTLKEYSATLQYADQLDEAVRIADLARELGNTGPNFARDTRELRRCATEDLDCFIGHLPPMFGPLEEPFRKIYAVPESAEQAHESIAVANMLLDQTPQLLNWFVGSSCNFAHLAPLFFDAEEFAKARGMMASFWHWPNVWKPACTAVWTDPRFAGLVEEYGFVDYWREVGEWPAACRPGGESFTCGAPD